MLSTRTAPSGASMAGRLAATTLSMCVTSRDCSPLPQIVGDFPSRIAVMKRGITALYWDAGS
jgi:hypothetical protein